MKMKSVKFAGLLCLMIFLLGTGTLAWANDNESSETESPAVEISSEVNILPVSTIDPDRGGIVAQGECGTNITWEVTETGVLYLDGTGSLNAPYYSPWRQYQCTRVVIGEGITSIDGYAFENSKSIESIVFPTTLCTMGYFDGCTSLKRVEIASISSWCNMYFHSYASNPLYLAHNLYLNGELVTDLQIPEGVTMIRSEVFSGCESIVSVSFPNSLKKIDAYAFYMCTNLKRVEIPDSVTLVYLGAFRRCTALEYVKLSASQKEICTETFKNCSSLKTVIMPSKLTSIRMEAFRYCTELTQVDIPDTVSAIGSYAFGQCSSITEITIPSKMTIIKDGVFSDCSSLTKIEIPKGITEIRDYAFSGCTNLTAAYIPYTVKTVGASAFANTYALKRLQVDYGVETIGENAFGMTFTVEDKKAIFSNLEGFVLVSAENSSARKYAMENGLAYGTIPRCDFHTEISNLQDGTYTPCKICGTVKKDPAEPQTIEVSLSKTTIMVGETLTAKFNGIGVKHMIFSTFRYADSFSPGKVTGTAPGKFTLRFVAMGNDNYQRAEKAIEITVTKPATPRITYLKNTGAGKITVKWAKGRYVSGYEVKIHRIGARTSPKYRVKGASSLTKVFSKLRKGKTYRVYVRAYKIYDRKTFYSSWSKPKTVKITR